MPDRTEDLRELFESVTGTGTVTERQQVDRGTLESDRDVREALREEIQEMHAALGFETDLPIVQLVTVLEGFYDGLDDSVVAERLETDAETVREARLALHLDRRDERPPEAATSSLVAVESEERSVEAVADRLDRSPETIARWLAVRATRRERRRVADRYRQSFESILADRDIADRLTTTLQETGLEDALEDQEVDVDL